MQQSKNVSGHGRVSELPEHIREKFALAGECWLWHGARGGGKNKYGVLSIKGRNHQAMRIIYELLVGPIPSRLVMDHSCRNTMCVNPEHLEPVTNKENFERGFHASGFPIRTHCKRGHELAATGFHLRQTKIGPQRICLVCDCLRSKKYRERKKAR